MAIQVDYPGVYIEEFSPGAPIQGVGTSTAAFLGPAANGLLNEPTKLTTWDGFLAAYGSRPRNDQDYLWYAVRGFFQNNGRVCYVLRVSNAAYDFLALNDRAGQPTLRLRARQAGDLQPRPIQVTLTDAHVVSTRLYRPTATISAASGVTVQVTAAAEAATFRPGDRIALNQGGRNNTVTVLRVENDLLRLSESLGTNVYTGGTVRLANLSANTDDTFRLEAAAGLIPGSDLTLTQGNPPNTVVVRSVTAERISNALTTYRVITTQPVTRNFNLANNVTAVSQEFTLTVNQTNENGTVYSQIYENLSMEPTSARYYANVVNGDPAGRVRLEAVEPPNTTAAPANRPADVLAGTSLAGGTADNPAGLTPAIYEAALRRLEAFDDVNLVAAPGLTDAATQTLVKEHCERMKDRFAILDSGRGAPPFGAGMGSVDEQRPSLDSPGGYAALYYPWLQVLPAEGSIPLYVPPSGHVAGVIARTDNSRGVFKAPAGVDAMVNGALGVQRILSDAEQGQLNMKGINVIRVFQSGGRPTVWGARTTATDTVWQYVPIRRLFLFLEESIQEGIRWAVFEPNNLALWAKLRRRIRAFLLQQWRDGALFGDTPEQAFYIRIDETLNPFDQQALGRLYIEVGVRPSYPAEFIIVRIGIWDGGEEVSESA